jgi:hypothetical protein
MDFWSQVATGVLSSVIVSVGAFFLILRKLPDKIEKRINERIDVITKLLNPDNAHIFSQLKPDNAYLSEQVMKHDNNLSEHDRNLAEHDKYTREKTSSILSYATGIKELVRFKDEEVGRRIESHHIMTENQQAYANILQRLVDSKAIMETLIVNNNHLIDENNRFREDISNLKEKVDALSTPSKSHQNSFHSQNYSLDDDRYDDENLP